MFYRNSSGKEGRCGSITDPDSDDDNEEGDYTVYECPGLAPVSYFQTRNKLWHIYGEPVFKRYVIFFTWTAKIRLKNLVRVTLNAFRKPDQYFYVGTYLFTLFGRKVIWIFCFKENQITDENSSRQVTRVY